MLANLLRHLAPFQPTLVGTYPLGLQIDGSDLDIACCSNDLDAFDLLMQSLGGTPRRLPFTPEASVTELLIDGLPVEIFCQSLPVFEQASFRHMIVEGRLLRLGGERLRQNVLERKRAGQKTEPAFAAILGLSGDPYAALLDLESEDDAALLRRLK